MTGADVAASDDPTGGTAAGGNLALEVQTGAIEQAAVLHADGYGSLLVDTAPALILQTSFGDASASDSGRAIRSTSDGNFIIAGVTNSNASFTKVDTTGDVLWSQSYCSGGFASLEPTSDGGYVGVGSSNDFGSSRAKQILVKTDGLGNHEWIGAYGGSDLAFANSVSLTSDGGYIITGASTETDAWLDYRLTKVDASGNEQWVKFIGRSLDDSAQDVLQTADGGYLIVGYSGGWSSSVPLWIVKTDSDGNTLWDKTVGGTGSGCNFWQTPFRVQIVSDGSYVIAGNLYNDANGQDAVLVKLDSNGDTLWTHYYGGTGADSFDDFVQLSSGGFALVGSTDSYGNGSEIFVVTTDSNGNEIGHLAFGGTGDEYGRGIQLVNASTVAIVGLTQAAGATTTDTLFATVAINGDNTAPTLSSSVPSDNATVVAVGSNIVLTFDEAVQAGTGNIVISNGTDIRTIDITDSSQVTITDNIVTINPTDDLYTASHYHVQLASGVINDIAGNAYAGISDTTTLDFATGVSYDYAWTKNLLSGWSNDGSGIVFDSSSHNIVVVGFYTWDINFNPNGGSDNQSSTGFRDAYIWKMDGNHTYDSGGWSTTRSGGNVNDGYADVVLDGAGNIYVAGSLDTGSYPGGWGPVQTVAKYASTGTMLWSYEFGTLDNYAYANSIALGDDGSLYVAGSFQGTVTLNGATPITLTSNGGQDAFLYQLKPDGTLGWVKTFGGTGNDTLSSVAVSGSSVYTAGYFENTVNVTVDHAETAVNGSDGIVLRYDNSGACQWSQTLVSSTGNTYISDSLAIMANGQVVVGGAYQGDLSNGIGALAPAVSSVGGTDAFVSSLNPDGSVSWLKSIGSVSDDGLNTLKIGNNGNIYVAGSIAGEADMDPGVSLQLASPAGNPDGYVLVLDGNGQYVGHQLVGSSEGQVSINDIAFDPENGDMYLTGGFNGTVDFDPGRGSDVVSDPAYDWSMFVSKYTLASTGFIDDVTGAVTELVTPIGNLTDSGTIGFTDVDLTDSHTVSAVTASVGALGTLIPTITTDTTGSGIGGVVTWNYSVDAAAVEYLAAGEHKVESFTFSVLDNNGGSTERTVGVTITGTNDAPVVEFAILPTIFPIGEGSVIEMLIPIGNLSDSGTIGFTDVDLTDSHTVSAVTASAGALGTLTSTITTDTIGTGLGGVVTWNYTVDAAAVEYLAAGEHKVESFTFAVLDGHGGSTERTVDVVITGTSDVPNGGPYDLAGAVTFWKSGAAIAGVTSTLDSAPAATGSQLVEFRNIQVAADGTRTVEIWETSAKTDIGNVQLELTLPDGSVAFWVDAGGLPSGWSTVANTDVPGQFLLAGMGITALSAGSVKLGTLTLTAPTRPQHFELTLTSGELGSDSVPAFGIVSDTMTTGIDGLYQHLDMVDGTYALSSAKVSGAAEATAIKANDALAALKIAVGMNPNADGSAVSPYQYLAADVNHDGSVKAADALNILKMAVKLDTAPAKEWLFVPDSVGSESMTRNHVVWPENPVSVTLDIDQELHLIGLVKGDVNGSWAA
jgi:VCBS repeat-containing protein